MSKRRPIHSNPRMNYRPPEAPRPSDKQGTRPTAEPPSVIEILTLMVLHICKKSIFFDTRIKVGIYLAALFLVSLIADFVPIPRSYFSRSDNIFNSYFVKFGWGWNLLLLIPFVTISGLVVCCGNIRVVVKEHLPRLLVATFGWWFWVSFFNIVENNYGRCTGKGDADRYLLKSSCLQGGHFWNGFDISGHSFILIYGSLVLIEEARVILGWENIKDMIRNEDHNRNTRQTAGSTNPLRNLSDMDFLGLKLFYDKFTPWIRGLFVLMTALQILWDVMLVCTMVYYHIMVEKFVGGSAAILTWFVTYQLWFKAPTLMPKAVGDGGFKYNKDRVTTEPLNSTPPRRSSNNVPKFMGMPIYSTTNGVVEANT